MQPYASKYTFTFPGKAARRKAFPSGPVPDPHGGTRVDPRPPEGAQEPSEGREVSREGGEHALEGVPARAEGGAFEAEGGGARRAGEGPRRRKSGVGDPCPESCSTRSRRTSTGSRTA